MLKILWKRRISPLIPIFSYLMLDFYVKTSIRFSLRDKRLFEITEVEITRVDCNFVDHCILSYWKITENVFSRTWNAKDCAIFSSIFRYQVWKNRIWQCKSKAGFAGETPPPLPPPPPPPLPPLRPPCPPCPPSAPPRSHEFFLSPMDEIWTTHLRYSTPSSPPPPPHTHTHMPNKTYAPLCAKDELISTTHNRLVDHLAQKFRPSLHRHPVPYGVRGRKSDVRRSKLEFIMPEVEKLEVESREFEICILLMAPYFFPTFVSTFFLWILFMTHFVLLASDFWPLTLDFLRLTSVCLFTTSDFLLLVSEILILI